MIWRGIAQHIFTVLQASVINSTTTPAYLEKHVTRNIISDHDLPISQLLPSYPLLHVQLYWLTPSVQVPLFRQGLLAHSLVARNALYITSYIQIQYSYIL